MCGLVGIVGHEPVNQALYDALTVLQHRGQDAAGIMTDDSGRLRVRKGNGLVRDVFLERHMLKLAGNMGLGHVRYPTAGSASLSEAQPFYVNSPYGICLAHNGNLVNADELKRLVEQQDHRHLNTNSDSEVLLNVFAHELGKHAANGVKPQQILDAVEALYKRCSGGYAVVAMIIGYGIVAFRDPFGIRPLVLGIRETPNGVEHMVASESVALDAVGFEVERDVLPGEAIFIDKRGYLHSRQTAARRGYKPCIFEFVYFARPDSIIDSISVYKARLRMGEKLAAKILRVRPDHDIDVVIPIPDTSRTAAMQVAQGLGVKYREGFIKNRYIGRTFIMPEQAARTASVRRKLNAIGLEFVGKNVLLVDDSVVRGTTCAADHRHGARGRRQESLFRVGGAAGSLSDVYGIDMPADGELVAAGRTVEQVQRKIGADWLIYQDLDDLVAAVHHEAAEIDGFDTSCFSGEYVTGDVSRAYLDALEIIRSNSAKARRDAKVRAEESEDDTIQVASGL
jgi:amidophosphoribosyltransferase